MKLIDNCESDAEKLELISLSLDVLAGIANEVKNSSSPDYLYMSGEIDSSSREKMIREQRKSIQFKTLQSVFEFTGVSISRATEYMVNSALEKADEIDKELFVAEMQNIKSYMRNAKSNINQSNLLEMLDFKSNELARLKALQNNLEESADTEASRTLEAVQRSLQSVDAEIRKIHTEITTVIPESHSKLRAEVESLIEYRAKELAKMNEFLEEQSKKVEEESLKLSEAIRSVKNSPEMDAIFRAKEALEIISTGLSNSMLPNNVESELTNIRNLAVKAADAIQKMGSYDDRTKISLAEITTAIQTLKRVAEQSNMYVAEISREVPIINNLAESVVKELNGYKHTIISSASSLNQTKEILK